MTEADSLQGKDDLVIEAIHSGETQREIAAGLSVNVATLNKWIHSDDKRSARAKSAMLHSAEAWLDRGLSALHDAPADASEIARARAIEQHCARRAAIRNPGYGDKIDHRLSGTITTRSSTMSDDELAQIAAGADK